MHPTCTGVRGHQHVDHFQLFADRRAGEPLHQLRHRPDIVSDPFRHVWRTKTTDLSVATFPITTAPDDKKLVRNKQRRNTMNAIHSGATHVGLLFDSTNARVLA